MRVDSRKDKHLEVILRDSHKVCISAYLNQRLIPTINSDTVSYTHLTLPTTTSV